MLLSFLIMVAVVSPTTNSIYQARITFSLAGYQFQPRHSIQSILNTRARSRIICSATCDKEPACRTLDFDPSSGLCRLFEADLTAGSIIASTSLTSFVGSVVISPALFAHTHNQSCNACQEDRYAYCSVNDSTCQCRPHTFWNGTVCSLQLFENDNCSQIDACRPDFNLTCATDNGQFTYCTQGLTSYNSTVVGTMITTVVSSTIPVTTTTTTTVITTMTITTTATSSITSIVGTVSVMTTATAVTITTTVTTSVSTKITTIGTAITTTKTINTGTTATRIITATTTITVADATTTTTITTTITSAVSTMITTSAIITTITTTAITSIARTTTATTAITLFSRITTATTAVTSITRITTVTTKITTAITTKITTSVVIGPNVTTVAGSYNGSCATLSGGLTTLHQQAGIFVSKNGTLYVADGSPANVLLAYQPNNLTGRPIMTYDNWPGYIFIDAATSWIYVTVFYLNQVQIWPSNRTIPPAGSQSDCNVTKLNAPTGIVVDSSGYIYISSYGCHRVSKWHPNGTFVKLVVGFSSGTSGSDSQHLNLPYGLVLNESSSLLYVVDRNNHRVQRFILGNLTGVTVAGGNGAGAASNQLNNPTVVFVSQIDSSYYICDYYNNRIQKWAMNAAFGVTIAGSSTGVAGSTLYLLNQPYDIWIDSNEKYMYISDCNNCRVQRYVLH